ncbi:MAG TPA: ABC transporter substrate-binding protein, partial [Candidatus Atribacteria bacterium]|nr:ABC transporter substrate-binding protein [Candidatus Atribacteria bacterium]
ILILVFTVLAGLINYAFAGSKDTLVVGITEGVISLDPANHRSRISETVIRNMFDGLVTRGPDMKIVPEIAESWEWLDDYTCEFKIRKGITFHNGEKLTAEDVEFTFNRILKEGGMDGESSPRKGLLGPLKEVKMVDDYTVRFYLSSPWPVLLKMLPHQQIVPKDYLEKVGTKEFREHPIGAGPFKFVEGKLNERIVMERFDNYYGGSPDLPPVGVAPIKTVIFEVIPETTTRISALTTGRCDIIQSVPAAYLSLIEKDPNSVVKYCRGTRAFNMEMNVTKPPFDNIKVREAMNYAIDMDLIMKEVYGGRGAIFAGPCFPYEEMFDTSLKPYAYNPELAKVLLKEAGYPDGFSVTLDTEGEFKEVSEIFAGMLSEVGINCTIRLWEWGVLKPLLLDGSRSLLFNYAGSSILDPIGYLDAKLLTNGRSNYSHYSNSKVDQLLNEGGITIDTNKRKEIYKELQRIVYEECPWVFGYSIDEAYGCRANVANWEPIPDGRINLHDVSFQ